MSPLRKDARGTVWFGKRPRPVVSTAIAPMPHPSDRILAEESFARSLSGPNVSPECQSTRNPVQREIVLQDPWGIYEPCASIYYGRQIILARHRQCNMEVVHIQVCAMDRSALETMVQTIDQHTHRSFLRLLSLFQHGKCYFLIWEPIECSLSEVFASKCEITESELAQIVWPILKGLRFLRDHGRELASLTRQEILFTKGGGVKIAGVENSRRFDTSKADAMTSNLGALLSIVETLMQKNGTNFTWSQDARGFMEALADRASARSLDDLLRHPFFRLMNGEGGLIPLVYLVNKTAYHELKLLRGISFRKTETGDQPMALPTQ
ncbi:hypothetical protein LV156_008757 [Aspergillus fumigatus]|nr:hypothetical protein LV156_008757 [Aspergillus fumigatus]KAJ8228619.1 hypothetical protein LV160_008762 [Aspergillus fumigatus]